MYKRQDKAERLVIKHEANEAIAQMAKEEALATLAVSYTHLGSNFAKWCFMFTFCIGQCAAPGWSQEDFVVS